jgi:hypothetical protein
VTPAVARLYEAINAERVAVATALGASVPILADWFDRVYGVREATLVETCQRLTYNPPVREKRRCRMHGGAAKSGAPLGNANALRHGHHTAEGIARRRQLSELIRMARATLTEIEERK